MSKCKRGRRCEEPRQKTYRPSREEAYRGLRSTPTRPSAVLVAEPAPPEDAASIIKALAAEPALAWKETVKRTEDMIKQAAEDRAAKQQEQARLAAVKQRKTELLAEEFRVDDLLDGFFVNEDEEIDLSILGSRNDDWLLASVFGGPLPIVDEDVVCGFHLETMEDLVRQEAFV